MRKKTFSMCFLSMLLFPGPAMTKSLQESAMITADLSGSDQNITIAAQNISDNAPSAAMVGRHEDGIGASGRQASAPSIKFETGFDPLTNRSELLLFGFRGPVARAELLLTYFYAGEVTVNGTAFNERGLWRAYAGGQLVGHGQFISNTPDGAYHLTIATAIPFDSLEILATPYVNDAGADMTPGTVTSDSSDFLVKSLVYLPAGLIMTSTMNSN